MPSVKQQSEVLPVCPRHRTVRSLQKIENASSSWYEPFKVHIKWAYNSTPQRLKYALEKALLAVYMNTHNIRQKLHKTQMPRRCTVSEKLALVSSKAPFLVWGAPEQLYSA